MRVPVRLSQRSVGHFAVAALNGALPALCGTFPVLGGVWRRPMSEALPELCGTFRTGGAEFYAARALAPEPGGPREEPARLVSLESGSSWSDGRRACPPNPKRAPRCDNPAISTQRLLFSEKMQTAVNSKILREFKAPR